MDKIALLIWAALWMFGGLWLAQSAFRLARHEVLPVGVALGVLLQTLLVNTLAQLLPLPLSIWLAAALLLVGGAVALVLKDGVKSLLRIPLIPGQLLLLAFLFAGAFAINRGLPLFDDYAHLPTVSILAAGQIPPHFPLDPAAPYAYHYFLMLFAAQPVRLGGLSPWVALDFGRSLAFTLGVLLMAHWARRLTRSSLAGWLAGISAILLGGTRWILLLFSEPGLQRLSEGVQLIGSGIATGPNLPAAMGNPWAIEGHLNVSYPFAFGSGFFSTGIMGMLGPNSLMIVAVISLLLLTAARWRGRLAVAVTALVVAAFSMITEGELIFLFAAFAILTAAAVVRGRSLRLPARLGWWLAALAGGALLGVFQGGALFDVVARLLRGDNGASYHAVAFSLHAAPALISRQLGTLSLVKPGQLLIALLEAGPLILVLPLLAAWGWKAWRAQRWLEAGFALAACLSLGMLFVSYSGSEGEANTTRLYVFLTGGLIFAVPLFWLWADHRAQIIRGSLALLGLAACLGGTVYLSSSLFSVSLPTPSYNLNELDGQMYARHWNQLESGALIFDGQASRAPTIFGRYTDAYQNWYEVKPAWNALVSHPDAGELFAAGYHYAYLDPVMWQVIQQDAHLLAGWSGGCADLVDEVVRTETQDFRRLYKLHSCGQ